MHYEYRCETCERAHHERLQAWKAGAKDPELDRLFGFDATTSKSTA
jgi:hypothetical protein